MYGELQWDDDAVEHVARHAVTREEVDDVFYDEKSLLIRARAERYVRYGQTQSGRFIKVVIDRLRGSRYYPVTAFDLTATERRLLLKRRGE